MASEMKFKVTTLAKDLGIKSKDFCNMILIIINRLIIPSQILIRFGEHLITSWGSV